NRAGPSHSIVCSGQYNINSGISSVICGGWYNETTGTSSFIGSGRNNKAIGRRAVIGGGYRNEATGLNSTIPGGASNSARGAASFAAGLSAKANHDGSFVISAHSGTSASDTIGSGGDDQIVLRADGGLYLTNISEIAPYDPANIITSRGGAYLSGNGTTWTNASDKNQKENFTDIDSEELLEKISALPISRWNYKDEDETVTHIGPVAQDFYALFGVGADDISISTIDPAGIALAAIKALNKENKELNERLEKLEKMIDELSKK
ncbi:MAG: tail fiber domain-containing protein, partial [candidate division Zixibacteria bacterium]|nr:tail fiber domain-containing protein [candidate division Zixibacteria bacterium]